jgi:DNA ligase-1
MADAIKPEDYYEDPADIKWKSANYYKRDTNDNIRVWAIWVSDSIGHKDPEDGEGFQGLGSLFSDKDYYIQSAHGVVGGTISLDQPTKISEHKSQPTNREQAIFDAKSRINDKTKSGYLEDQEAAKDFIMVRPMGANHFKDRGHNIIFPAIAQRKYDGNRVLITKDANGKVTLHSRGGEIYHGFTDIENAVKRMNVPAGFVLDGELYQHGKSLQAIGGLARKGLSGAWAGMSDKAKAESSAKKNEMYIRVYDGINTKDLEEPFFTRYNKAMNIIKGHDTKLKKVESYIVRSPEELWEKQEEFVKEGYEGAMVRNLQSVYKFGPSKSNDLLKLKNFDDDEFLVVGATDAGGGHSGAVLWECQTTDADGNKITFTVTPLGSITDRRQQFKDKDKYIGEMLTVKYMGLNPQTNIPNIAKGVAFRSYGRLGKN